MPETTTVPATIPTITAPDIAKSYYSLSGYAKNALQKCTHDQGENVENKDFDMNTLCVTKADRGHKLRGSDYKSPYPTKHPYEVLIEAIRADDIVCNLTAIQETDDEQHFLETKADGRGVLLNFPYEEPLQTHKRTLSAKFTTFHEKLLACVPHASSFTGRRDMQKVMTQCIQLLIEMDKLGCDGCAVHRGFKKPAA